MPNLPLIAASLPAVPTFIENLQYQITGLLVVLTSLAGLAVVVWIAGKIFAVRDRGRQATIEAAAIEAEHIPGPIFAAIAAAVQVALEDQHFVIHGIKLADPRGNMAWSAEGRRSIYASKNLR
jgi:hypothetical protein